jgi:hypothetical protein
MTASFARLIVAPSSQTPLDLTILNATPRTLADYKFGCFLSLERVWGYHNFLVHGTIGDKLCHQQGKDISYDFAHSMHEYAD